jgi:hypothetical protein
MEEQVKWPSKNYSHSDKNILKVWEAGCTANNSQNNKKT